MLITQPDHAALAGRIAGAWRSDGLPDRPCRPSVLLAAHEHDNGWIEEDARPRVDRERGRPYDFIMMPDEIKQAIWPRAVSRLATIDRAAAGLIAQHAVTVNDRHRGASGWRHFFEELEGLRNELCGWPPGMPPNAEFLADYGIVFLGDLMSLIFCNGWTDAVEAGGYRLILRGAHVEISPDPFGGATLPLEVAARRVRDRRYRSDADLDEALNRTEPIWITGQASGPTGSSAPATGPSSHEPHPDRRR